MEEMRSRFNSGFSSYDRELIERLYLLICGKPFVKTNCSDCYRDAYLLIFTQLKKDKKMPNQPKYVVKAGVVIHPFGTSEFYTNPLTDEVALDFLAKNENNVNLFAQLPSNWKEELEAHLNKSHKVEASAEENAEEPEKSSEAPAEVKGEPAKAKRGKKNAE